MFWPCPSKDHPGTATFRKDGTFAVIPQMPGGVTSPAQLRKIADVAEKYKAGMVKLTGGQRIDILGVKNEDLPNIWRDLDMRTGSVIYSEVVIGPLSAIPAGQGCAFQIAGERIAVFNTRGSGVFAVQADCLHKGAPLADGLVGGTTVICPLHAWKFDLTSGNVLMGDCGLKTYPAWLDEHGRVL